MSWIEQLSKNRQRGSHPRCLLLMDGETGAVAERLTRLVNLPDVRVSDRDNWMPKGIPRQKPDGKWDTAPSDEPELDKAEGFLNAGDQAAVKTWWLAVRKQARTPNWDIASTCKVGERPGLLLVEAKAHDHELEILGKREALDAREGTKKNHAKIGAAIAEAKRGLSQDTGLDWQLSRDDRYQLSNRFAWAWKLTELGYPVVLVYLGFLNAGEMQDLGKPFADEAEWTQVVRKYSEAVVPDAAWGQSLNVNGQMLIPLIRTLEVVLPAR